MQHKHLLQVEPPAEAFEPGDRPRPCPALVDLALPVSTFDPTDTAQAALASVDKTDLLQ